MVAPEEDPARLPAGETARFIAFRSHWHSADEFCITEESYEKGAIEGEAGYLRPNHWVPIAKAGDLTELNIQLLAACRADEQGARRPQPAGST